MTQLELPDSAYIQTRELSRVMSAQLAAVLDFCTSKLGTTFHCRELNEYVAEKCPTAPGSPDRVLRAARSRGLVNYEVVSRSESLYRVLEVKPF